METSQKALSLGVLSGKGVAHGKVTSFPDRGVFSNQKRIPHFEGENKHFKTLSH